MNKYSSRLTDAHSRLLDAEAVLNFLRDRENLQTLLDSGSPDVVVGSMVDKAWELVANAIGDCEALREVREDELRAELKELALTVERC